jgi:hypothetical protein
MSDAPAPPDPAELTGGRLREWFAAHGHEWGLRVEFHSGARETVTLTEDGDLSVTRPGGTTEFEPGYLDHVATDAGDVEVVSAADAE